MKMHLGTHTGKQPFTCDMCRKSFKRSQTWSCIYAVIQGSCHNHVMYVRNLSNSQIPWNFIYAFKLLNCLLHVAYVRKLTSCYVPWSCIYTLLLESVCLHVMYVRNLLNSQVPHNGQCPFMCALCKNPSSSQTP